MRIHTAIATLALLLPSLASAQLRMPRIGGRHPAEPVPPGKQPEAIARSQALVRSRYSVEAYPLISRMEATGPTAGSPTARWTSVGSGTHLDWRQSSNLSLTLDLTASYLGGQASSQTAELGTRIRPEQWDHRARPFADLRVGFQHVSQSFSYQDLGIRPSSGASSAMRYGSGFGAVAGAGVEYYLTNMLALTTAVSAMRSSMSAYRFTGLSAPTTENSYRLTSYRLSVGLRYNPVRYLRSTNPAIPTK
jgi:hypothetical protein